MSAPSESRSLIYTGVGLIITGMVLLPTITLTPVGVVLMVAGIGATASALVRQLRQ